MNLPPGQKFPGVTQRYIVALREFTRQKPFIALYCAATAGAILAGAAAALREQPAYSFCADVEQRSAQP
jgi:hypothetical protein